MTFYELEKRCKQRRLKRLLYLILGIVFVLLLFIIVMSFSSKKEVKPVKQVDSEINLGVEEDNIFSTNNTTNEIKVEEKENFQKNKKLVDNKKEKNSTINVEKPLLTPIIPSLEKPSKKMESKIQIIKTTKPKNSIVEVDTLPSYKECIKLAKKYLREKKYDLALKWAKNANIQNKSLPDSWVITAKALFYSGKKEKAIEILKIYLKFQKNKEVENVLKEFENEKTN